MSYKDAPCGELILFGVKDQCFVGNVYCLVFVYFLKIIFYSNGSKYDCLFKTDEDALLTFDKLNKYSGVEDLTKDRPKIRKW